MPCAKGNGGLSSFVIFAIVITCILCLVQAQHRANPNIVRVGNKYYNKQQYLEYYYSYFYSIYYREYVRRYADAQAKAAAAAGVASSTQPPAPGQGTTCATETTHTTSSPTATQPSKGTTASANDTSCTCPTPSSPVSTTSTTTSIPTTTTAPGNTTTPLIPPTTPSPGGEFRIPLALHPINYELILRPGMYNGSTSFDGYAKILMECMNSTDKVYLHMKDITISDSSVRFGLASGVAGSTPDYTIDSGQEFVIFQLNGNLQEGELYSLELNYTGKMRYIPTGFHSVAYKVDGNWNYLASSQSKPTYARRILPCFDEPAIKATFDVTIEVVDNTYSLLTNSEQVSSVERADGSVAVTFNTTHPMSTYQLGFAVVAQFATLSSSTSTYVPIQMLVRTNLQDSGRNGFMDAKSLLPFFEDYFQYDFPLEKIDMFVSPEGLVDGMESWGLMIFRESDILYNSEISPTTERQAVTALVSRETSQQWFGNLVSPAWWDDLWLDEGFASYMAYVGGDHLYSSWKMLDQFVPDVLHDALRRDNLKSSHPVHAALDSSKKLPELYDTMSRAKGAALMRMMSFFLGEQVFRDGLKRYFTEFKYGSATHDDLWSAMANATIAVGQEYNVKKIMDTWTLQMNYPVVIANRTGEGVMFSQERFLLYTEASEPDRNFTDLGYKWEVPITFTHKAEQNFSKSADDVIWLSPSGLVSVVAPDVVALPASSWIIANVGQIGYYRVNYDDNNWINLIQQLKDDHTAISSVNRAQLISDSWNLARAKHLQLQYAFTLSSYLTKEREYVPWKAALRETEFLARMLSRHTVYGPFTQWLAFLIKPTFDELGMNGSTTTHTEELLKLTITKYACLYGVSECVQESKRLFEEWMRNSSANPIDPNLKEAVYCTALKEGGEPEWSFLFTQYKQEEFKPEKTRLLKALTCTKETWLIDRLVRETILEENGADMWQDTVAIIVGASENRYLKCDVWDFFNSYFDMLQRSIHSFVDIPFFLETIVEGVTEGFSTQADINKLEAFKRSRPDLADRLVTRIVDQAIERATANMIWLTANWRKIKDLSVY